MYKSVILIAVVSFCLISLTMVGLAMTIKFWYLVDVDHYKSGTCRVVACHISQLVCSGTPCNVVGVRYALLNGTTVTPYQGYFADAYYDPYYGTCPEINSTMSCYYDNRNIMRTLSQNSLSPPSGALSLIIGLCVVIFFTIIISLMVIAVVYGYENSSLRQEQQRHMNTVGV